jgi:hypothetical protein
MSDRAEELPLYQHSHPWAYAQHPGPPGLTVLLLRRCSPDSQGMILGQINTRQGLSIKGEHTTPNFQALQRNRKANLPQCVAIWCAGSLVRGQCPWSFQRSHYTNFVSDFPADRGLKAKRDVCILRAGFEPGTPFRATPDIQLNTPGGPVYHLTIPEAITTTPICRNNINNSASASCS